MKMMRVKVVYSTALSARLFAFPINTIKRSGDGDVVFASSPPQIMINFCVMRNKIKSFVEPLGTITLKVNHEEDKL